MIYLTLPQQISKASSCMIFSVLQRPHDVLIDSLMLTLPLVLVVWWVRRFQDSLGFGAGELLATMDPSGLGNQAGTKVFRVVFIARKWWCERFRLSLEGLEL